eukprot:13305765-Alexandrium_andersonii.AAC.1
MAVVATGAEPTPLPMAAGPIGAPPGPPPTAGGAAGSAWAHWRPYHGTQEAIGAPPVADEAQDLLADSRTRLGPGGPAE